MNLRHWTLLGLIVVTLGLLTVQTRLIAQDENRQGGGNRGGGGQFDPAAFRQRQLDAIRDRLGADDAQWKAISPRLEKVITLNAELQPPRGFGRRGFGGGAPGGNANSDDDTGLPETTAKTRALSDLLDQSGSTDDQVKKAMQELRAARQKAETELAQARKDLRDALTLKQQGQLLVTGILD